MQSLDDLRRAIDEQRLRTLKGFGGTGPSGASATRSPTVSARERSPRTSIAIARPHAERLVAELARVPGVTFASHCGSLRRFSETVGDIDIVIASTGTRAGQMDAVVSLGAVDNRVLARGESRPASSRAVAEWDVRVRAHSERRCSISPGPKSHNVKLRQRARRHALYAERVRARDSKAAPSSPARRKRTFTCALRAPAPIPPVLREDWGEIEAAEKDRLPRALGPLFGDFHVHGASRDASSSLGGDGRDGARARLRRARARRSRGGDALGRRRDALLK